MTPSHTHTFMNSSCAWVEQVVLVPSFVLAVRYWADRPR